ncbi:hypothetical protein ACFL5O_07775 [Myxococcota bacterium]
MSQNTAREKQGGFIRNVLAEWLTEDPALSTQELLRRAKEAGYAGKKTAFYALVFGSMREQRTLTGQQ